MIRCDTCPYCKDEYPGKVDAYGNRFHICGMTGNIVYKVPRKEKKYSGKGWIHFGICSCGLFQTVGEVLETMTESERRRYYARTEVQQHQQGGS